MSGLYFVRGEGGAAGASRAAGDRDLLGREAGELRALGGWEVGKAWREMGAQGRGGVQSRPPTLPV